jgi:hypothetical protein
LEKRRRWFVPNRKEQPCDVQVALLLRLDVLNLQRMGWANEILAVANYAQLAVQ